MGAQESNPCRPQEFKAGLTSKLFSPDCSRQAVRFLESCWPPLPHQFRPPSSLIQALAHPPFAPSSRSFSIPFSSQKPIWWDFPVTDLIMSLAFLKLFSGSPLLSKETADFRLAHRPKLGLTAAHVSYLLSTFFVLSQLPVPRASFHFVEWASLHPHTVCCQVHSLTLFTLPPFCFLFVLLPPCFFFSVHQWTI